MHKLFLTDPYGMCICSTLDSDSRAPRSEDVVCANHSVYRAVETRMVSLTRQLPLIPFAYSSHQVIASGTPGSVVWALIVVLLALERSLNGCVSPSQAFSILSIAQYCDKYTY